MSRFLIDLSSISPEALAEAPAAEAEPLVRSRHDETDLSGSPPPTVAFEFEGAVGPGQSIDSQRIEPHHLFPTLGAQRQGVDLGRPLEPVEVDVMKALDPGGRAGVALDQHEAGRRDIVGLAQRLDNLGLSIISTEGTWKILSRHGIPAVRVLRIAEGRPNITDYMKNGEIRLVVNTPSGKGPRGPLVM